MNILVFGNGTLFVGQQERSLCYNIAKLGHKVYLICDPKKRLYDTTEIPDHENLIILDFTQPNFELKIEDEIDVVIGMDQSVAPYVADFKKARKIKSFCMFLDFPLHVIDGKDSVNYNFQYAQRFYYWISCALTLDDIIFINPINAEYFKKFYNREVSYIRYPIIEDNFLDQYTPVKSDYIVSCSRIVYFKGTQFITDAMRKLPYNWKHITSTGDLESFTKENKNLLGTRFDIIYKASDYEKMKFMANGYVFIYPQITEHIGGLVPIEAMSVNTPAICFDYPVLRWLFEDSILYVKPKSILDLREKISNLYNNDDIYKEMQQKGYDLFKKYYTKDIFAKNLIEIIK